MCTHSVHFYADAYPAEEASDFIAAGLLAGDTCIVMLIQPHRQAVEQRLTARGIKSGHQSSHSGSYIAMDTHDALSQLMVDGRLDHDRATEALGSLMSQTSGSGRVRLAGDPSPVLFAAGNHEDAIALEALVDKLATLHSASVFCAYPIQGFYRDGNTASLVRVSAEHSVLEFPEGLWVHGYLPSATLPRVGGLEAR